MSAILYVEDHPPARFLMQAIIEDLTDYALMVAENGASAQQIARDIKPLLYVLDMDLPDTDGLTLAKVLQSIHSAPVILVSAYAEAIREDDLDGMIYLPKPLEPQHVADVIRRTLG